MFLEFLHELLIIWPIIKLKNLDLCPGILLLSSSLVLGNVGANIKKPGRSDVVFPNTGLLSCVNDKRPWKGFGTERQNLEGGWRNLVPLPL